MLINWYLNLLASDLFFATSNTKQSSFIDLVNKPRYPINTTPEILVYLKKILIARDLSEELLSQKHSMTTYLKKLKLKA